MHKARSKRTESQRPGRSKIDWSLFAIPKVRPVGPVKAPKGKRPAQVARRAKQRKTLKARRSVKDHVFERDGKRFGGCVCRHVSPICTVTIDDRHEIIPVGKGGKVTIRNAVGVCRADHDAAHGEPGAGRRIEFTWDGPEPDAEAGNYRVHWRPEGARKAGDDVRETEPVLHGPVLQGDPDQG
jgi:hypothetical protein